MNFGVVVFPGTWSDVDCFDVLSDVFQQPVDYVWHKDTDLSTVRLHYPSPAAFPTVTTCVLVRLRVSPPRCRR